MNPDVEILAPAGSFEAAVAAFEGGADAVYLGLSDFSARKAAKNFSKEELLSLKTFAAREGKKIFAALNTVIKEDEIESALDCARFLYDAGVDAVILQDIGFAALLKKLFPDLPLHASTQMAVHTVEGVKFLKTQGFSRVVLSREVPFDLIAKIKKEVPDMELEVFVHGALCYSFSGLCLASGMVLGRSGNRGMCAQLCRSYYETEDGKKGYFFSCNDLEYKDFVQQLKFAGVDSFKIEGRMKLPEYVFHTSALYRAMLERSDYFDALKNSRICFARKATTAYFKNFSGNNLICGGYPGHRGVKTGVCEKKLKDRFFIKTKYSLGIHDGLLFFKNNDETKPFNCSVEEISSASGKNLKIVGDSSRVYVKTAELPEVGDEIYLVSSRSLERKKVNSGSFPQWKKNIFLSISIRDSRFIQLKSGSFSYESEEITVEKSENQNGFKDKFAEILKNSADSFYFSDKVTFDKNCENVFVVPSVLKKIRTDFYEKYADFCDVAFEEKKRVVLSLFSLPESGNITEIFSERALMNPDTDIPFFMPDDSETSLKTVSGFLTIPLLPLMKESEKYLNKINNLVAKNGDKKILVGLSNLGHLNFALEHLKDENIFFFIDFSLYIANRFSYSFFKDLLGEKLLFGYSWIEEKEDVPQLSPEIIPVSGFHPPLFVSAGCFERSNGFKKCAECGGKRSERILTNCGRVFKVVSKNCVTFMFMEQG
ncbi:U32 family peptidase [bacterium]|nr:U32 family peptidase [bacterium]